MRAKKKEELLRFISKLVEELSFEEKKELFDEALNTVPLSIFKNNSGLEAVVLYLKYVKNISVKEISKLLNRNVQTIYTTYNKAKAKKVKLNIKSKINVPIAIFSNRKFSFLESLVSYLRDQKNFTLVQISKLTNKSQSTIKTVYWRYKKKCKKK